MPDPPVITYLLNTRDPAPYQIFRAFIITHDSQNLERFRQWVDRILEDHVPLLVDRPNFIRQRVVRPLESAKTAPLIVNHLAMPDEFRTARTLPSPSPPTSQYLKQQGRQHMTWTPQAHQGQAQAQLLLQASHVPRLGHSSTSGQIQGHGLGRGRVTALAREGGRGAHGRGGGGGQ
ncbi:hypothetical protein BG015_003510 [Linnemannia schmuckeri]|uniref:Uncharacterized protein n=1 Tax=Linnemannia schmuckeri TaxID=64567 RepID=A0A9P5S2D9_9FUNG|nr:hypothetical protein BG015_003510 [Linnemannia schmuckeri]